MKAGTRVYEEWFVTSLVRQNDTVCGVVAMDMRTGELHLIKAKAVILCTGGAGRVYEPSSNALICTGDGYAQAYRVGAPLMDMEMVQYHPTTLPGNGALMTEGARGEGAYLINANGERFMKRYAPNMMELASRDVVSRAEQTEINEGRDIRRLCSPRRSPHRPQHNSAKAQPDSRARARIRRRGHYRRALPCAARYALHDGWHQD